MGGGNFTKSDLYKNCGGKKRTVGYGGMGSQFSPDMDILIDYPDPNGHP